MLDALYFSGPFSSSRHGFFPRMSLRILWPLAKKDTQDRIWENCGQRIKAREKGRNRKGHYCHSIPYFSHTCAGKIWCRKWGFFSAKNKGEIFLTWPWILSKCKGDLLPSLASFEHLFSTVLLLRKFSHSKSQGRNPKMHLQRKKVGKKFALAFFGVSLVGKVKKNQREYDVFALQ